MTDDSICRLILQYPFPEVVNFSEILFSKVYQRCLKKGDKLELFISAREINHTEDLEELKTLVSWKIQKLNLQELNLQELNLQELNLKDLNAGEK